MTTKPEEKQQQADQQPQGADNSASFAETALRMSGKTDEEARRTGAVDKADDQVESLFAAKFKTSNSPVHKAVWDNEILLQKFDAPLPDASAECLPAMERSLQALRAHQNEGNI